MLTGKGYEEQVRFSVYFAHIPSLLKLDRTARKAESQHLGALSRKQLKTGAENCCEHSLVGYATRC